MEALESIKTRKSVRVYQAKPIDSALLEKIVDAARCAPSARAEEPWEFVVVQEKDKLSKLGQIATSGSFIRDAASCIAVFCRDTKYYLEDGCAATENVLIAAAALGLGACWVAGEKKAYAGQVADLLNASPDLKLVSLIPLGWPKETDGQVKKRSLSDVIHWERF